MSSFTDGLFLFLILKELKKMGENLFNVTGSKPFELSFTIEPMHIERAKTYIQTDITKVIFNDPATIVFWKDGTKTVVKCENETYDPEKGFAMAIAKKVLGNKGNYYETFKKWLPDVKKLK